MLCEIGILVFIDKNIPEKVLVMAAYIGIVAQQDIHEQEDIVEIHGVGTPAPLAVDGIDFSCHGALAPVVLFVYVFLPHIYVGSHEIVFGS